MNYTFPISLICLIGIFPFYAHTQSIEEQLATLDSIGEYHFHNNNLDSSLLYNHQARRLSARTGHIKEELIAYNWLFYLKVMSGETDSLAFYFEKMNPLAKKLEKELPEMATVLSDYWNSKSYFHYSKGEYYDKLECDKKSLVMYEMQANIDTSELAVLYQVLGIGLEEIGDYYQANIYSKKALNLIRPSKNRKNIQLDSLKILVSIGQQLYNLKEYQSAQSYYLMGESVMPRLNVYKNQDSQETTALFYLKSGENYLKLQTLDKAKIAFDKAEKILVQNKKTPIEKAILTRNLARYELANGNKDAALDYAQKVLQITEEHFKDRVTQQVATHNILGDVYVEQGKIPLALNHYQKGLQAVSLEFESDNINENPSLNQTIYSKINLLTLLQKKADALHQNKQHKIALSTYHLAIQLFNDIRKNYITEDARLFLSEKMGSLFEKAIELSITLEQPELAFQLAEQNKSLALYEALKAKTAFELANLPDTLIEQVRQLKIEHNLCEKELFESRSKKDSLLTERYADKLFQIKRQQEQLDETIAQEYPTFLDLKFDKKQLDLDEIKAEVLDAQTAILEYFVGENTIYIFTITADDLAAYSLPKTAEFDAQITDLQKALGTGGNFKKYHQTAAQFYDTFVKVALERIDSSIKKLIIVADDKLHYIPFEALLTETVNPKGVQYSNLPYLIHRFQISYAYSMNLLQQSRGQYINATQAFMGFAPTFSDLSHNEEAVQSIQKILSGTIFIGEAASKKQLLSTQSNAHILHLSTHAKMDDEHPLNSKIFLADDVITTGEIYNLPFQVDLAVLSACETGIGELKKGEGVISLGRAFKYAGCPSVVTSLWEVDDRSTTVLMDYFYQALVKNMPKDEALHQAKLQYLNEFAKAEQQEALFNPYHWAAFVHIGNRHAIGFENTSFSWTWWLVGIGALGLLGLVLYRIFF